MKTIIAILFCCFPLICAEAQKQEPLKGALFRQMELRVKIIDEKGDSDFSLENKIKVDLRKQLREEYDYNFADSGTRFIISITGIVYSNQLFCSILFTSESEE